MIDIDRHYVYFVSVIQTVYWYGPIINSHSIAEFWLLPDQGHVPLPFAAGYIASISSDNDGTLSMNLVSCEMINQIWAYVAN